MVLGAKHYKTTFPKLESLVGDFFPVLRNAGMSPQVMRIQYIFKAILFSIKNSALQD